MLKFIFFVSRERRSAGKRLIGFDTPETVAARNVQGEFNIHNLELFNPWTMDEAREGLYSRFSRSRRVFIALFAFYLFVLLLLHTFSRSIRQLTKYLYIPVPPF